MIGNVKHLLLLMICTPNIATARMYQEDTFEQSMYEGIASGEPSQGISFVGLMLIIGVVSGIIYLINDRFPNFFINAIAGIFAVGAIIQLFKWLSN